MNKAISQIGFSQIQPQMQAIAYPLSHWQECPHVAQGHECVDQSATTGKRAFALSSTAGGDKKRGGRKVSGRTDLTKLAVYVEPSGLDLSRLTCMYRLGSADVLCHMDARDGE